VILRAYSDSSGHNSGQADAIVTLAGLCASDDVWPLVETAWGRSLDALNLRAWHTADLHHHMKGGGTFRRAAAGLLGLLAAFRDAPLRSYAVSVPLRDYRAAREAAPSLEPLEALCVDVCIRDVVLPVQPSDRLFLYFDQNESFYRYLQPRWREARQRGESWARQIEDMFEADSTRTRAIQAADLLAWASHRFHATRRLPPARRPQKQSGLDLATIAALSTGQDAVVYDRETIVARYGDGWSGLGAWRREDVR
jgi:uncharacterized protein DUF3800